MRLEQLVYIVEVAQSKSISLAAERSYISQPAISSSISKLEVELGVTLFKRTSQGMYPTEIGEIVIQKASDIIDQIEEIKAIAKVNAMGMTGDIKIAVEPSFCNTIMVNILTTYKYKYPNVNVMLKVGESNNILHDILAGKADIGIILKTEELQQVNNIFSKELFKDKLMVLTGKTSSLAAQNSISMAEALEQPLVLYNTEYISNCGISQTLSQYGPLKVAYRFDDLKIIEKVIASGTCIAFVPQFMADYYKDSDSITALPIHDVNLETAMVMIWTKRHRLSIIEKELFNTIKSLCSICEFV